MRYLIVAIFLFVISLSLSAAKPFITKWKINALRDQVIDIKINPEFQYNYSIDCDSDGVWDKQNVQGDYRCLYNETGEARISITGQFPNPNMRGHTNLIAVEQWGDIQWLSMREAFKDCINLNEIDSDPPDLSRVKDMSGMFRGATSFDQPIGNWDVGRVKNLSSMFIWAFRFDHSLQKWEQYHIYCGKIRYITRQQCGISK